MAESKYEERRKANLIREVLLPTIVAVVTGIGSSFVTTQVTIAVIETRLHYLESDFTALQNVINKVGVNTIEIAKLNGVITALGSKTDSINTSLEVLHETAKDRYTAREAAKDYQTLVFKIQNHKHEDDY